jgi:RimJ/RimL family protein N-acetyltransferase
MTTWPVADAIATERLRLEPIRVAHASELAPVLDDETLHTFIGGRPLTVSELCDVYTRLEAGQSPDGSRGWLNWLVRELSSGAAAGTVQATLSRSYVGVSAAVAWVIGPRLQARGYAKEAAAGMVDWLTGRGVSSLSAYIHPANAASTAVAQHLGLVPTDVVVDGETRWIRDVGNSP